MEPNTSTQDIQQLIERLFPISRSITGNGVRETLAILEEHLPIQTHQVPTGTKAFDWTVPEEWNITDAYIIDPLGNKIVDFKKNNLHVVGYSTPINTTLSLTELKPHLYSLPEQPELIPYKTSYYNSTWGFCLPDSQLQQLQEGNYKIKIDATLQPGALTYGELLIPGISKEEVLVSCYICHPSMANDSLSGVMIATFLAKELLQKKNNYSYRFVFVPETIGAIMWLSRNSDAIKNIRHGLVATCCGDGGAFTYKKSRRGNAPIDRAVTRVLKASGKQHSIVDFFPLGSDERQYCSPAFNLPVGSLMRSMYYKFPEYHTSADSLNFVNGDNLKETLAMYLEVVEELEQAERYRNTQPYCEPQLGKRGLYSAVSGRNDRDATITATMWVLNYSDSEHSLTDIAELSGIPIETIRETANLLVTQQLLEKIAHHS